MAASWPPLTGIPGDAEIDYPTSDGRPMGETDLHRRIMADAIERLSRYFAGQQVYVSGNILLFYEQGSPLRHVSPDVLVTNGLAPGDREQYLLWREGRAPDIVIEITSKSTRREDLRQKFALYRDVLRVREYFLYDPCGDYLSPPLQGYRLAGKTYRPVARDDDGSLVSVELGLTLKAGDAELVLFDARGRRLLTGRDAEAQERAKSA